MAELKDGILKDAAVAQKIFSKIEKGAIDVGKITGIVIHQTNSQSAESTFNAYTAGRKNPHSIKTNPIPPKISAFVILSR